MTRDCALAASAGEEVQSAGSVYAAMRAPLRRGRLLTACVAVAGAACFSRGLPFVGTPRTTSRSSRTQMFVTDPVNNIAPETREAGLKYARRFEDMFLMGRDLWANLKAKYKEDVPPVFIIGTNGNSGEEIAESLLDSLAYIPAPDGTYMLYRREGPTMYYSMWITDKLLGDKTEISPTDLFIENEEKYYDIESQVLQEFMDFDSKGYPKACVVGEGAILRQKNIDIMKKGIVIWLDADPVFTWVRTQMRHQSGGGLAVAPNFRDRPPVWAIANGWDGDVDDAEGKMEYMKIVKERRVIYESLHTIRLRVDIPGVSENSYWAAERILKAMNEHYGFVKGDVTVEQEVMEKDLAKFLEGARLSKYYDVAIKWCDEQGAASIEDLVDSVQDFGKALALKPLEQKRLEKAIAAVVVAAS